MSNNARAKGYKAGLNPPKVVRQPYKGGGKSAQSFVQGFLDGLKARRKAYNAAEKEK